LLEAVVYNDGLDEEQEFRARSRWDRFVADIRERVAAGEMDYGDRDTLAKLVQELINLIGRDAVVSLSADYAQGNRLDKLIEDTVVRISELPQDGTGLATALSAFSADRSVRIMSIHKSKGLEFHTVIMMGVEKETFWGKIAEERSAFFVGISRAKRRLALTICQHRDRPQGAKNWSTERSPHAEFVGYAQAYA
jgi:superfamily I DNA/RNA helicase